jgi:hypothetical protein
LLGLAVVFAGCAGSSAPDARAPKKESAAAVTKPQQDHELALEDRKPAGGNANEARENGAAAPELPRKIIYKADVRLIVRDLPKAESELKQLLKDHKGIIAQAEISGSAGSPLTGRWRLRVPVDRFDSFLDALVKLGIPERNRTDSEDVTDRYYDLEARIKNRKAEEESLRKLLEKTSGKMEDILAVRRELNQVRNDIDVQEGQLRRLANLSALTRVEVTMVENQDYVPPQTPTFGDNIASTFGQSVAALKTFGRGLVYVVVAIVPWAVIMAIVGVPAWIVIRRRFRRVIDEPAVVVAVDPPPSPTA